MYTEIMNDYIAKGYAQQLSKSETKSTQPKIVGVTNINKPNRLIHKPIHKHIQEHLESKPS